MQRTIRRVFIIFYSLIPGILAYWGVVDSTKKIVFGIIGGSIMSFFTFSESKENPIEKLKWSWREVWTSFRKDWGWGVGLSILAGIIAWFFLGTNISIRASLFGFFILLFIGGFEWSDIDVRIKPNQGIDLSRMNAIIVGLVAFLIGTLISSWQLGLSNGLFWGYAFGGSAVINHYILRLLLYNAGNIPWKLVPFLDYCCDLIFLRRVGGGYIFIHRLLMEHFAEMYTEKYAPKESQ